MSSECKSISTAPPVSTHKFQAPTKWKPSLWPPHENETSNGNGKSCLCSQRKSPPETHLLSHQSKKHRSNNTKYQSNLAGTSVQSQASVEIETKFQRLVDGGGKQRPNDKP